MNETILKVDRPQPGVVELVLNRPGRRNALTVALLHELGEAVERLAGECRVLILRGEGEVFCSGLDLSEAMDRTSAQSGADGIGRVLHALAETPLVTIAAAQGYASAGGAGLLAACDLAVASEGLKLAFPEVRRGLVPALVSTVLRKKLRDADLRELLLLAEPIGADRALSMGLVHRVVPEGRVRDEALSMAGQVLRGGPQAVRSTKAMLAEFHAPTRVVENRIAHEYHIQARIGEEAGEGLAAFLEKREPRWS